jgi:RNA polymerase sigma-70 factor (ECF subfamily)
VETTLERSSSSSARCEGAFQSTLWSQVRLAGDSDPAAARQALEQLCRLYWQPVFAFLRRCGHDVEDAKDLTQGFFAYVLDTGLLKKADPDRGRFRSFLLGCLKFFVSNEQAKSRAIKRGGGTALVSIDMEDAPEPVAPAGDGSPDQIFDRKWAVAVLREAMHRLKAEHERAGMAEQFAALQPHLTGDAVEHLPAVAARIGKSEAAVRVLLFRLRNRFRRATRAVIAETVTDVEQVEMELRHLEAALRGR